jgi:hypothetical protein
MEPLPPLNKVFSMVLQHERQGNFASLDDSNALINAARSRFATPSKSPPKVCTFCGRDNHTVDNCFKKHGLPPHLRKGSKSMVYLLIFVKEVIEVSMFSLLEWSN